MNIYKYYWTYKNDIKPKNVIIDIAILEPIPSGILDFRCDFLFTINKLYQGLINLFNREEILINHLNQNIIR